MYFVRGMNILLLALCPNTGQIALNPGARRGIFAAPALYSAMKAAIASLFVCLLACSQHASAFQLQLDGLVTEHATLQAMDSARIRLYKNGVLDQVRYSGGSGVYSVKLDNHALYVVRVDAPGYQTKCFTIDTHGMEWEGDHRMSKVEVEVRLVQVQKGIDLSYFDLPMGMARFEPATGVVLWDLVYEEQVRSVAGQIMGRYDMRYAELLPVRPAGNSGAGAFHSGKTEGPRSL